MKFNFRILIYILLILAIPVTSVAAAPLAKINCDPAFVSQKKNVITIKPTGVNDTSNIQCAFDAAVDSHEEKSIKLAAGTFYTQQIAVQDFDGRFMGAGVKKTEIVNIPQLSVTPNFWFSAPSATNLWPTLFSFVDGDVVISDLAIHIVGTVPTNGWAYQDVSVTELYGAIFINGTKANARIDNILVEGEHMADAMFGYNLINGVFYTGFIGETMPYAPMSGYFSVSDSTFRVVDSATPYNNLLDATVVIDDNTYEDVWAAMEGIDAQDSDIRFTDNKVNGIVGVYVHEMLNAGTSHSKFFAKDNKLSGATGIVVDTYFGDGNACLLLKNDAKNATELGIYLGEGTKGCLVTGNKKTTVLDLGVGNILIGVTRLPPSAMLRSPLHKQNSIR